MSHVYCPECGFQNLESANYCSRCGALLVTEGVDNPTETISLEELEEAAQDEIEALGIEGPALVVRSGGGRAGEQFLGSLNGTFLNRHRIEKADLENGDEVQIGKYRLIYLAR